MRCLLCSRFAQACVLCKAMADPSVAPVVAAPNGQPGQAGQNAGTQSASSAVGGILRMLVVFWLVKSFFGGSKGPPANAPRSDFFWPKFNRSEPVDFFLYLSESSSFQDVSDKSKLVWSQTDIPLATNADISTTYVYRPSEVRACIHAVWLAKQAAGQAAHARALAVSCRQCKVMQVYTCMRMQPGRASQSTQGMPALTATSLLPRVSVRNTLSHC